MDHFSLLFCFFLIEQGLDVSQLVLHNPVEIINQCFHSTNLFLFVLFGTSSCPLSQGSTNYLRATGPPGMLGSSLPDSSEPHGFVAGSERHTWHRQQKKSKEKKNNMWRKQILVWSQIKGFWKQTFIRKWVITVYFITGLSCKWDKESQEIFLYK